jgi:hypothetical protein
MLLSTTRAVQEGEALQLSYGERGNDDFFCHYGFVPRANPHDAAVLFAGLQQALEWHYEQYGAQQVRRPRAGGWGGGVGGLEG